MKSMLHALLVGVVAADPKCCWSKWGDKDACGDYVGPSGVQGPVDHSQKQDLMLQLFGVLCGSSSLSRVCAASSREWGILEVHARIRTLCEFCLCLRCYCLLSPCSEDNYEEANLRSHICAICCDLCFLVHCQLLQG